MSRTGDSFPDPRVNGDPRLLKSINDRSPRINLAGGELHHLPGGVVITPDAPRNKPAPSPCPFGRIVKWIDGETLKTGIKGGSVTAGPNVFTVADKEINLASSGSFVVYLDTDATAYFEDDVILPGIEASVQTTMEIAASYPAQTIPTVANSAEGTSIVPLGSLTVADGKAVFSASGCGDVILSHCPGSLSYERVVPYFA